MKKHEKTIARLFIILTIFLFIIAIISANMEIGKRENGYWFHATPFNYEPFTVVGELNGRTTIRIMSETNQWLDMGESASSLNLYLSRIENKARIFQLLTSLFALGGIACLIYSINLFMKSKIKQDESKLNIKNSDYSILESSPLNVDTKSDDEIISSDTDSELEIYTNCPACGYVLPLDYTSCPGCEILLR